jgi:hypothetical protein
MPADSIAFSCRADKFLALSKVGNVKCVNGLGYSGASLAVLPLDTVSYSAANIAAAPYAEFLVPVTKGDNVVGVRCLPSFPLYPEKDLRYAISINGSVPQFVSIKCEAKSPEWTKNVIRGFALGTTHYNSDRDGEVKVKIYFADPAIAISQVDISRKIP